MQPEAAWPDWYLKPDSDASVRELARYANPVQALRLGFGLGATGLQPGAPRRERSEALACQVIARRVRYTVEPFNPGPGRGQIIRTTQELLDGAGTCVDFAVTMAALLIREDIPAVLAVAIPDDRTDRDGRIEAHTFALVGDHPADVGSASYDVWHDRLTADDGAWLLLDLTPDAADPTTGLAARQAATLRMLQRRTGTVHTVDVRSAVEEGAGFRFPPSARRDLGITAFLPDPPAAFVEYPSHAEARTRLAAATGRVLLIGPSGTGKSTLALNLAERVADGRGWFLTGSDEDTLRLDLAAAEAQSRGEDRGSTDKDNANTGAARALQRLARSERPWAVWVDNANGLTDGLLALLPATRPAAGDRPADLLVVTSTDDTDRAPELEKRGWVVQRLGPLSEVDAETVGPVWALLSEGERLPGLARIATWCRGELASDPTTGPGPERIVRAALGKARADAKDAERAVGAAAFMPAEGITRDWVARAAFDGDAAAAAGALGTAERAGLVERSRAEGGDGDAAPLWMHRLVRTAVQGQVERELGFRALARRRTEEYGRDEIAELDRFVSLDAAPSSADGLLAAVTVVDLWEGRGRDAVESAATLGASFVDRVDDLLGLNTLAGVSAYVRGQLAVARRASHGKPTAAVRADAIARCVAATAACTPLVEAGERDARLLRGRADAMYGILRRGEAKSAPDAAEKLRLTREAVAILLESFRDRRAAFRDEKGNLLPDTDHHIDRAWYNLGGTYINVANLLHEIDPSDAGEAAIAAELHHAMAAYAGSLSLRRGEPTNYTAASLWGVALVAYSAALYCPGRLDLTGVAETEELAGVLARQDRTSLLLAAEQCASTALRIWTDCSGSPNNARELLLKIELAWFAKDPDPVVRARQFVRAVTPAVEDLEITTVVRLAVEAPEDTAI